MFGTAVWCDASGKLLLYSDGITAWDGSHRVIPNATDLGGHTSTNEMLIVPRPGYSRQFYIFSSDPDEAMNPRNRYYALIDLETNFGKGLCRFKRRELLANPGETITAVPHCNGKDYWLLHSDRKDFLYIHRIDSRGIHYFARHSISVGIASLTYHPPTQRLYYLSAGERIHIGIFEPGTGDYSPYYDFPLPEELSSLSLEISPNGKYLYCVAFQERRDMSKKGTVILKFDVSVDPPSAIPSTMQILFQGEYAMLDLQLAPDGNIYAPILGANKLGCIRAPNEVHSTFEADCINFDKGGVVMACLPKTYWLTTTRAVDLPRYALQIDRAPGCSDTVATVHLTFDTVPNGLRYEVRWYRDGVELTQGGDSIVAIGEGAYCAVIRFFDPCMGEVYHSDTLCRSIEANTPVKTDIQLFSYNPCDSLIDSVRIRVRGGTPPYRFSVDGGALVTDSTFRLLRRGRTYRFVVRDAQGCTFALDYRPPPAADLSVEELSVRDDYCDLRRGRIAITVSGEPPYRYSLDGVHDRDEGIFDSLSQGTYTITVHDARGCSAVASVSVQSRHLRDYVHFQTTPDTCGAQRMFTHLAAGDYTVYVRDSLGCAFEETLSIRATVPPRISRLQAEDCGGLLSAGRCASAKPTPLCPPPLWIP